MSELQFPTDPHGWSELLPARQASPPLEGSHRVPWVIIGAGITGLAAARRLGENHPDDDIILLDARLIGQGASGRNSGFAVAISHFPRGFVASEVDNYRRVNRINQAGLDILRAQVEIHKIDCQWREDGFHHATADPVTVPEARNFQEYLQALEIPHTPLDNDDLAERLGSNHYRAGVHVHQGALVQPAQMVRGLADNLPGDVKLYEQSPVLRIASGAPITLHLSGGQVLADKVILATNYEAPKLGYLRRRISATTLAGSFTRKLTEEEISSLGSRRDWGLLSLHGAGATIRLTTDGRISIRNTSEFKNKALLSDKALTLRQATHRGSFERRFPQLAHVPFEFGWSGVEGISRNGTNFFGEQSTNIYLAGGYNGSGVTRGTAFGTALADYASGEQSPLITDCLASPPAAWIPPRPILDIGAWFTVRHRFRNVGLDA